MQYTISEFAQKIGLTTDTLRYYEKERLLQPNRANNNHRTYTEEDVRWMQFIIRLKETHMPISQIRRYVALYAQGDATIKARKEMLQEHQKVLENTISKWLHHYQKLQEKIENYEIMCLGISTALKDEGQ